MSGVTTPTIILTVVLVCNQQPVRSLIIAANFLTMNNEVDRHVTNDKSRDEPATPKFQQTKALKTAGTGAVRTFKWSSFRRRVAGKVEGSSAGDSTDRKGDWICSVCSFHNMNDDDQCFRCQFVREKPALSSKYASPLIDRRPGAYQVVEKGKHQQLRPVQSDNTYLRKTDNQQKTGNAETSASPPNFSASSGHPRHQEFTFDPRTVPPPKSATKNITASNFASVVTKPPRRESKEMDDSLQSSKRSIPNHGESFDSSAVAISSHDSSSFDRKIKPFTERRHTSYVGWSDYEKGPWECSLCTYVNEDEMHLTCAICGHRRVTISAAVPSHGQTNSHDDFSASDATNSFDDIEQDTEIREEEELRKIRMNELIMMQYELMAELNHKPNYDEDTVDNSVNDQHDKRSSLQREESLNHLSRQLSEIVSIHEDERKQQRQITTELQVQRSRSTIEEESATLVHSEYVGTPSTISLDGQQRKLDKWQNDLDQSEKRINELRRQQEELVREIEKELSRTSK